VTRVEIQSGAEATLSESLSGVFQLCYGGEARGWCVGANPPPSEEGADPASEGRRR
jgi:hypothetical protein